MTKTKSRIKSTSEVFTPLELVSEMLDKIQEYSQEAFIDPSKTYLDNSCGNGQFLIEVLKRKIKHKDPLSTIHGVDLMADNVCDTIARLIFYINIKEDIFDDKGQPKEELKHEGYHDQHNFDWLKVHKVVREYGYKGHKIIIHNKDDEFWLFEYKYDRNKWCSLPNIICADALRYHYRFDNSFPYDDEAQKMKQEELTNSIIEME